MSSNPPLERMVLPFSAIVNHEPLKLALLLNAINPRIGGLLITGPKGTGKTTIVRALAALLPEIPVVKGCTFRCNPEDPANLCMACKEKLRKRGKLLKEMRRMRVIDLPLSATEDRVVGSLDVERAIKEGIAALKPGILASANQMLLYVDEINLLPDHLVDALLDAAATGINVVEREGISVSHPAQFIFLGSMNPEEGELRPQLLDRFPLSVSIERPFSVEERVAIIKLNLDFDRDPEQLREQYKEQETELRNEIVKARKLIPQVKVSDEISQVIAYMCSKLLVDGVRPDIVIAKAAMAYAALDGRTEVTIDDVQVVSPLALSHRTRQRGILEPPTKESIIAALTEARKKAKSEDPRGRVQAERMKEERSSLVRRMTQFHSVKDQEQGERFQGKPPRRRPGRRIYYTGFVCFYFVLAAYMSMMASLFLPFLFPATIVLGGLMAAGLLALFERVLRYARRPGFILPSTASGDSPPGGRGKFRRATHRGSSQSSPTTAAAPPSSKSKSSLTITTESGAARTKLPSLIRLEEGKPLFEPKDLLESPYFVRHRTPKWAVRQIWRRTGSARSHQAEGGALHGARIPHGPPRSIHIPASITAASPYSTRTRRKSLAVQIRPQDVREKRYRAKTPLTIVFVLDLSISMLKSLDKLQRSLLAFKACLEGTRDRVGLIALKDWGSAEVQAPTANWTRLLAKLMSLRLSGYTPLAAGLQKALETLKREKRRNPGVVPLVVVFSDFLPNIRLGKAESVDIGLPEAIADVLYQCHLLGNARIPVITVNLHKEFFKIKDKRHHDIIEGSLIKSAQEQGLSSLIEVGIKEDKLVPFLGFYMAHLTGGRTYLSEEINEPAEIIPAIMSIAHRGAW
ncbi:MAG: VWA domain-containing protein [Promethearchaeota archaeon]